jgi:hypothetical protein
VSEWITKADLAMLSPRHLVIFDFRFLAGACGNRTFNRRVWVVDEQLDPSARGAERVRAVLRWVVRVGLMEEDRSAIDFSAGYPAEVPQLGRAQRVLVPGDGC